MKALGQLLLAAVAAGLRAVWDGLKAIIHMKDKY